MKLMSLVAVVFFLSLTPLRAQLPSGVQAVGDVHMDVTCSPSVAADFDVALALLHNFWYARALESFNKIIQADPQCAMAYWGAAMTYYHPFWDPPTNEDLSAAWALVQKGLQVSKMTPREAMYLDAVAALYKNAGTDSPKSERDQAYLALMKATADKYPDDETRLFYGQMLLSTMPEGQVDDEIQPVVANILEEIYSRKPTHPGVLHYLTHVYDDPVNAEKGLVAARAYSKSAAAVPHAHHMPSHIFVRLGLWEEAAEANESAWRISEEDVKHAGEHGGHRDFHALNYLQYTYIQLGRYRDAKRLTDIFQAEYDGMANKKTAPDTPLLQAKHLKGRTIFGLPDRVAYGYFDTLTRYLIETGDWQSFSTIPLVAPSRDFVAMKTQLEAAAAAKRGDSTAARAAADKLVGLSNEPGQDPFVKLIITIQAKEAEAFAAHAAKDEDGAIRKMNEAIAIEDSIYALSQPPYPAIPAHEILGSMLMEMNRPSEASKHFTETLVRTPGRPKAIYGIARAAQAMGDKVTAQQRYQQFLAIWKNADSDLPELATAKEFLAKMPVDVKKSEAPGIMNFSRLNDGTVGFGGATQPSAMAWLKKEGFASVISLRLATEQSVDIDASRAAAQAAGLNYIYLPFNIENPDPQLFDNLQIPFTDKANQPIYIHCASANRVAFLWMIKRVLEDGWEIDKAEEEAEAIGLTHADLKASAVEYVKSHKR
ncbi:MAG: sulfur transferase domain-containing protein [Candidatus Sulfotelmatobacter sp.]